jgi:peptide deformylase
MALLDIIVYPDDRLRIVAKEVDFVSDDVRLLVSNMAETMYTAPGIGLAAIQVNVPLRIIMIDISETRDDLQVFVNPEILERNGEQVSEEGCLSVPDIFAEVTRAQAIRVRALDLSGKGFETEAEGLLAVCIQHEIDHLDGKVFVDYLSRLKQDRIRKKLKKFRRDQASAA